MVLNIVKNNKNYDSETFCIILFFKLNKNEKKYVGLLKNKKQMLDVILYISLIIFPTGAVLEDDTLYIYYGAADERIAVASLSLKELLMELDLNKL